VTCVGVAVEAVAAATDVGADRIVAGCSGRACLLRIPAGRSALIHIYKNTPGGRVVRSIKPLLYRHPATHTASEYVSYS